MPSQAHETESFIDQESLKFLEDVRKGKPRRYVLSTKGSKVRSLIVKKKNVKPAELKAARGGGYQPMFGVVEGQGANIIFYIARADGFDCDPLGGKVTKLKEFLKEQTGKPMKPEVRLVDESPAIPFDEEEMGDPMVFRFMNLEKEIESLYSVQPDQVESLAKQMVVIRQWIQDDDDRHLAEPEIAKLETQLRTMQSSQKQEAAGQNEKANLTATDTDEEQDLARKFATLLQRLKPLHQQAVTNQPEQKTDLNAELIQLVQHIKQKEYDQAKQGIREYSARLKAIVAEPTQPLQVDYSGWLPARQQVIEKVKATAKLIADENHPQSRNAIIELKQLLAKLVEKPDSMNQIDELEKFLTQDGIVNDFCELVSDIRTPLLHKAAELKLQLAQ